MADRRKLYKKLVKESLYLKKFLRRRSKELNRNLPKSEQWFRSMYKKHMHPEDRFNCPLDRYIPDVINFKYRYIIEIDGSIHNTPKQIKIDAVKDAKYKKLKFNVFRIKDFSYDNVKYIIDQVVSLRNNTIIKTKIINGIVYNYIEGIERR